MEEFKKEKKPQSCAKARGTLKWNERERCNESLTEVRFPYRSRNNIFKRFLITPIDNTVGREFSGEFNEKHKHNN